ncbi:UNVERIFIED_CONTAM: hypothetical protein FKN15_018327 [Acipenser sinensis]
MLLVEFYKWAPDLVRFTEPWKQEITFLDKLKGSLNGHAPKDQAYSQILEYVYNQLLTGQG